MITAVQTLSVDVLEPLLKLVGDYLLPLFAKLFHVFTLKKLNFWTMQHDVSLMFHDDNKAAAQEEVEHSLQKDDRGETEEEKQVQIPHPRSHQSSTEVEQCELPHFEPHRNSPGCQSNAVFHFHTSAELTPWEQEQFNKEMKMDFRDGFFYFCITHGCQSAKLGKMWDWMSSALRCQSGSGQNNVSSSKNKEKHQRHTSVL